MSDDLNPAELPEKPEAKGIELDANGDPVRQGSLMNERQSYERVIEGLKIAADAAVHIAKVEQANGGHWQGIAMRLDQARRIAVQYAGLGLAMKEKQTEAVRGDPMRYRKGRDRFREGLMQAAGGLRQLATCHRGDLWWSRMATDLENLERKVRTPKLMHPAARNLILPAGFTRH